jgi:hypothetical protein
VAAEDLVEQFGVALEIVQELRWSEGGPDGFNQTRMIGRGQEVIRTMPILYGRISQSPSSYQATGLDVSESVRYQAREGRIFR